MSRSPKEIKFLKNNIVIFFVRLVLSIKLTIDRVWSKAYCSAIFPKTKNLACHWSVEVKYPEKIEIGDNVVIGKSVTLGGFGGITLGNNVRISKFVTIESASLDFSTAVPYKHISNPIIIEDDVWIGTGAILLSGIRVEKGAVIGAGAIVTKSVNAGSVVVGPKAFELRK
ncbi:acyltransferase [Pseudoalteromonas sp. Angola-31]|nr:acyltransferase [Pseudoalteromonas sp. Angola-31]